MLRKASEPAAHVAGFGFHLEGFGPPSLPKGGFDGSDLQPLLAAYAPPLRMAWERAAARRSVPAGRLPSCPPHVRHGLPVMFFRFGAVSFPDCHDMIVFRSFVLPPFGISEDRRLSDRFFVNFTVLPMQFFASCLTICYHDNSRSKAKEERLWLPSKM